MKNIPKMYEAIEELYWKQIEMSLQYIEELDKKDKFSEEELEQRENMIDKIYECTQKIINIGK